MLVASTVGARIACDSPRGLCRPRNYEPDGALTLFIGADPGAARASNWLPSSGAPFALFLRAYLPSVDLLEGRYRLPAIDAL